MIERYDHKTLVEMFDSQNVSPILPYESIDADVATIKASTQASGRISISGVQPKYAMVVDNGRLRFAREGEQGRYILKIAPIEPHIIDRPWVPVNEWLTMRIAEQVYGITTAKNTLCYFGNGDVAYITKRFDVQPDGTKWMQEDFASIADISKDTNGPDYKYNALSYAECGALIDKHVSAAMVEKLKFFRIVVFNYLTLNDDAHLKNFSLIKGDDGEYHLAPAYDLINETNWTLASSNKLLDANLGEILLFCKFLKSRQVHCEVLLMVDVLETTLRNTALQRHLTTFESNLSLITRTCLSTLVSASRCATKT